MNLGMPYRKRLRLPARGVVAALVVAGAVASQVAPGAASTRNPFLAISAEKAGRAGPADPSGVPMPKGNLPGWTQVYANDFTLNVPRGGFSGCIAARTVWLSVCTGLPAGERRLLWAYPSSYRDNSGHPYNPPADLSISHGELDDYLHHDAAATALPKIRYGGGGGMVHGAYVVRFRANPVAGLQDRLPAVAGVTALAPGRGDRLPRGGPEHHHHRQHALAGWHHHGQPRLL